MSTVQLGQPETQAGAEGDRGWQQMGIRMWVQSRWASATKSEGLGLNLGSVDYDLRHSSQVCNLFRVLIQKTGLVIPMSVS